MRLSQLGLAVPVFLLTAWKFIFTPAMAATSGDGTKDFFYRLRDEAFQYIERDDLKNQFIRPHRLI